MIRQRFVRFARVLSASVAVTVFLTASLTGCGGASKEKGETAKSTTSSTTQTSEPTKLSIAVMTNPNIQDYPTNKFTQFIEKNMNVKFDFVYLPAKADDARSKLSMMVVSGSTLPDIINTTVLSEVTAFEFASKGVFIKLNDYYKDPSLAPNFQNIPEEDRKAITNYTKLPDGNIYSVPSYNKQHWNEGPYRAWINTVWLDKLNLKAPTTTDELYNTLKAFVEKDPNGNGKKDEIGLVGSSNGWCQNPFAFLMNSFLPANPDTSYFDIKDGKVVASFIQSEWKQGLEYMNKLVKDGLLSPLSFTQDGTQLKSLINVQGGMAGIVTAGSGTTFDAKVLGDITMSLMAPVKGPKGTAYTPYIPSLPINYWYITKDCKNPKVAFKVGDYMLNPEVCMFNRFGQKGVQWSDDPSVISQYQYNSTDKNVKKIVILDTKWWSSPQNDSWQQGGPIFLNSDMMKSSSYKIGDQIPFDSKIIFDESYVPCFPKEAIAKLPYTNEEVKKISDIKATIDKYVKDTSLEFICGNKPLTGWDSYINELNKMGLAEYIAVNQAAFNRTK